MSYSSVSNIFRGLAKASFAAGVLLLGLTVSGAQAATIDVFSGDEAGWTAAAGLGGPILTENFGVDAGPGPGTVPVAWGSITFSTNTGPGNLNDISGGAYNDRANGDPLQNPLFTFSGLGVTAFGANWDLGPNDPGTGIRFFVTFAGAPSQLVLVEIPNGFGDPAGFFGIVSDMRILSIRLDEGTQGGPTANFETFAMTNAQFVSAVPIPAALPLFLSAIAALGFMGRRRKRMAAA